jgi:hypothetical protein
LILLKPKLDVQRKWMVSGGMMVSTSLVVLLLAALAAGRQVEVEDVTARQLEAAIQTEDILAVFWCKYTGTGGWCCHTVQFPESNEEGYLRKK